ncbi:hypothetical protein U6A24_15515 [Aquimarina gracilis]|uniref:Lipid-binding SYLF domain-containing protein n=1 Tax=Aquimarina gracilis TaxID=874422 RepID=A0ABU5ZYD7_9FLAO|nr:hypothetical protein [Aquimarina gracilis]MEB3346881.1 hypothetical protein [Aquimarina gracilis]
MNTKTLLLAILFIVIYSCKNEEKQDFDFGDELELNSFIEKFSTKSIESFAVDSLLTTSTTPKTRAELEGMRTVVKIYDGKQNAGIKVPGFGGLTLGRKQSNMNVYFVETKIVETPTDTTVYGIGYSIHYLFSKVKRGIDITNLASVAASAQLQSNKTSVSFSLQSFGIVGKDLGKFFKPEVNSNFDVDGFGVIQSKIDGIHNVITDSILASRTKFTPEKLYFISSEDLRN